MPLTPAIAEIPLAPPHGVVRVGATRVTLDSVVGAFRAGATPEEIAQQFPTLALADVYQVLAYYLNRTAEVESYLASRQKEAALLHSATKSKADSPRRGCVRGFLPADRRRRPEPRFGFWRTRI